MHGQATKVGRPDAEGGSLAGPRERGVPELGAELLVLERDDESVAADRSTILARRKLTGYTDMPGIVHKRAHEDCLLSVPDAVAWAWSKAGRWHDHVKPVG
jgi:hypothetical protein